jgi:hypothetical protein
MPFAEPLPGTDTVQKPDASCVFTTSCARLSINGDIDTCANPANFNNVEDREQEKRVFDRHNSLFSANEA